MDVPSLTGALTFFETLFNNGRTLLGPSALMLLKSLVVMEVVFAGLYLAIGGGSDLKPIARKVLLVGFLAWIVQNYTQVLSWVIDGFLFVGQRAAGGSTIDIATLRDPHALFIHGMQVLYPLEQKLFQSGNTGWFGLPSADSLVILICLVISVFCYGLIAIQVFVSYLEFIVLSAAGFIFIPFGAFKPTAFLSERVFGAVIGMGVKLLVLALIVGATDAFIQTMQLPPEVTHAQSFQLVVVNLALAFLSLHAPSLAMGLLSGHPALSASTVVATGIGAGLAASGAASVTGKVVSGASSPVSAAVQAGTQLAGMARAGVSTSRPSPETYQAMSGGQKFKTNAMAAAGGIATGLGSALYQRMAHGSDFGTRNSAAPRDKSMTMAGFNPNATGFAGAFERGKHSVPAYRESVLAGKQGDSKAKEDSSNDQGPGKAKSATEEDSQTKKTASNNVE